MYVNTDTGAQDGPIVLILGGDTETSEIDTAITVRDAVLRGYIEMTVIEMPGDWILVLSKTPMTEDEARAAYEAEFGPLETGPDESEYDI